MEKCPCKKCKKQMKIGVDSLIDEGAPNMVIIDYINDMTTGQWTQCENCSDNNFTAKDETKGDERCKNNSV